MLELNKVHVYKKVPGSMEMRLVSVNPVINVSKRDGPSIFIQGGCFYYANGKEVKELPNGYQELIDCLSDEAKKSVGIYKGPIVLKDYDSLKEKLTEKMWKCSNCEKTMPLKKKGLHIAGHKRSNK